MLRKQRKKRTIVVDHVVLYRCFTVVSWGHGGKKKMYSGTVVLLFVFVLVGLRAVWYCFLVV